MSAVALTDRYAANLHGVLPCYDRIIIITGTLPGVCYADQSPNEELKCLPNSSSTPADAAAGKHYASPSFHCPRRRHGKQ